MRRSLLTSIQLLCSLLAFASSALAQQPESYIHGTGSGLTPSGVGSSDLTVAAGATLCLGTLSTLNQPATVGVSNGTNYVYISQTTGCGTPPTFTANASQATFQDSQIPIAVVRVSSGTITNILDVRPWAKVRTGPTLLATDFPGTTADVQINNCLKALPTTGGVCDARGLTGSQTLSGDMFDGVTKPVTLLVNRNATFTVSATQHLHSFQEVLSDGPSATDLTTSTVSGTLFQASTLTPPAAVLEIDGAIYARLQNLTVSCQSTSNCKPVYIHNSTSGHGNFCSLSGVSVLDFKGVGITVGSTSENKDPSQFRIEGPALIRGSDDNPTSSTAVGIQVAGGNSSQGSLIGPQLHIRRVHYGLEFINSSGEIRVTEVLFGDPAGTLAATSTLPAGIHITGTGSGLGSHSIVDNSHWEAALNNEYNDVGYNSILCDAASQSLNAVLNLRSNRMQYPVNLNCAISVLSQGNVSDFGPLVVNNGSALVVSEFDKIQYRTEIFSNCNIFVTSHDYDTKGTVVLPTASNGHYYRVSVAGTSGTSEPTWCTTSNCTVTSNTVTFQEVGAYPGYLYSNWTFGANGGRVTTVISNDGKGVAYNAAAAIRSGFMDGVGDSQLRLRGGTNQGNAYIENLGNGNIRFATNGSDRWLIDSTGRFLPPQDNTYDIGSTMPLRPRSLYVGSRIVSGVNPVTETGCPDNGAVAFDASFGNTQKTTLSCAATSSLTGASGGQVIHFLVCHSGAAKSFSWPSNVKGGMTIPQPNQGSNTCNAQTFVFDSTSGYAYALFAGQTM